jgi:hypothetical protein
LQNYRSDGISLAAGIDEKSNFELLKDWVEVVDFLNDSSI